MRAPWALALPLLLPWVAGGLESAASPRRHGLWGPALQPGLCRYGPKLACCYGWRRGSKGACEATCEPGCKFGECVGPNKCRCFPGYTGKSCSQDVNECGEKPRPCQHRCVNTHGSYKCFCLSGHMLTPNATCANSRTCAMTNCQYGCEDTEGGPRCRCPSSGLRLAPNGRLCIDIDECASGKAVCPYDRRCVNTFGSYYCKCHLGFELKYVSGRYDCVDINECAANTHVCSPHANCLNTPGSFRCTCKQGYKGSGLQCSVIPDKSVKEVLRAPGTIKDRIKKLLAHKNSVKKKVKIKNIITEPAGTPSPKGSLRPFNSEEGVSRDGNPSGGRKGNEERKKEGLAGEKRDETAPKNHVEQEQSLRGDVFPVKMSAKAQIAARASLIEQLMAERNFEDLGNHLMELETLHVTKEHLQQTEVVRAVYRVLKNCPTVALKKKAKCLLSEWKALYKDPRFKPRDSPKFFPTDGKDKNSGLSSDSSQNEALGSSSSDSLLSSQDVLAKSTEMIVPANSPSGMEPKEEYVRGSDLKSTDKKSSELLDPAVPVRMKCTELLHEALTSSSTDQSKAELWQNFAREIEEHIFTLYSKNLKKYKTCIRSKVANLKNPQNSHLQQNLLSGTMSPREFAEMTVMEMASKELKQLRASYTESSIQEHCLPQVTEGTETKKIKCRHCEKFNCKVTVIARGTLFLPGWVQSSNPDEQMLTYVICNECGEQWYHSNWVCL